MPEFRRKGLAKLLLKATEEWTAQDRLTIIALHVLEPNHAARALYESSGYPIAVTHKESYFYEKRLD
ncbi:MAG: GNAT family N-acetyltransferase [Promethearchaeota archaeon]